MTRDPDHPENIGLNDVLGNYSLTLIDSLSTLAILASSRSQHKAKSAALEDFQTGVAFLVEHYGDGTPGPRGQGRRARGFDVDSKVQVFETVIRGVGGLLSAHLFAIGDLPNATNDWRGRDPRKKSSQLWQMGFVYDGQLLRLAHDLASRLLPAFYSPTGLPYPRVNLRHGIPFYLNSYLNQDPEHGQCDTTKPGVPEITETCSAGAGSLVLEFTTLSRLTGDGRFEKLAKRAFWEVWNRRSSIGLIGAGLDAETGLWVGPTTGIGAGIDSFFEYALKSHVLLSGSDIPQDSVHEDSTDPLIDPNVLLRPLTPDEDVASGFLAAWQEAHATIKRHLYRNLHHPHYINAHVHTGAPQALWIDSLGAYYAGLLTLGGELDEAIEANLLYTALWTRYSALPERWSTREGGVEGGLGWWPGRPEFIESNYHLYRATKDPWYLYVGEMVLRDIKRRCWTRCGWAGLQDVRTGELTDRMESFFLGETAKYLFLLFDEAHPLNTLDAPFVFTTEGHPLMIPRTASRKSQDKSEAQWPLGDVCPRPPEHVPLSISATAARQDIFHAASLTKLHLMPNAINVESPILEFAHDHPSINLGDLQSPTNYTFYPWTLPFDLIPTDGMSSKLPIKHTFEIQFPATHSPNILLGQQTLTRVADGIFIHSLEGLRLGLVLDDPHYVGGMLIDGDAFRIHSIGSFALGRDEKVFIKRDVVADLVDPFFARVRNTNVLDLLLDLDGDEQRPNASERSAEHPPASTLDLNSNMDSSGPEALQGAHNSVLDSPNVLSSLLQQVAIALSEPGHDTAAGIVQSGTYLRVPASTATGPGAAPLPDVDDIPDPGPDGRETGTLPWTSIYLSDETCEFKLPLHAASEHAVLVMRRGHCSFSRKLANVPSFAPSATSLRLVVVVSDDDTIDARPLLDEVQRTPGGLVRPHQIPMVLIGGGDKTYESFRRAKAVGLRRHYLVQSHGVPVANLIVP